MARRCWVQRRDAPDWRVPESYRGAFFPVKTRGQSPAAWTKKEIGADELPPKIARKIAARTTQIPCPTRVTMRITAMNRAAMTRLSSTCGPPARIDTPDTGPGLTDAGKALVRACNQLGILVDLSHLNEKGFWDVARISDAPLVATHSNAHVLCPLPRNLTDSQLDAIMESDPFADGTDAETTRSGGKWRLTSRETDVLRHMVEGKTNPEIASDLFISERTVTTHVGNILNKLGFDSRVQIASWIAAPEA